MPVPPKTDPVRRNARTGPLMLPASGRSGPAPAWPLPSRLSTAERLAWEQMWATPQATVWETLGWTRTVARYCRKLIEAEKHDAPVTLLGEVRQMEDRLGLTPRAMRMLLWQIAPDEVGEKREERTEGVRDRLRAVETG